MYDTDDGSMSLSWIASQPCRRSSSRGDETRKRRTGTFFCEITTAQSFPRTPTEVMLAAVMALNAYSEQRVRRGVLPGPRMRMATLTDLVQTALFGEDGNVSVVTCAA